MEKFPILSKNGYEYIPYGVIAAHEKQALKNHSGQTLQILASRGGLSWFEAYAVLTDTDIFSLKYISQEYYREKVLDIVKK